MLLFLHCKNNNVTPLQCNYGLCYKIPKMCVCRSEYNILVFRFLSIFQHLNLHSTIIAVYTITILTATSDNFQEHLVIYFGVYIKLQVQNEEKNLVYERQMKKKLFKKTTFFARYTVSNKVWADVKSYKNIKRCKKEK